MATTRLSGTLVLVSKQNGIVIIQEETPLTRLNYFDGKFLRASDLKAEQDYLRQLIRQSNQAGGPGIAHGFDITRGAGDTIQIGPGLAIDPEGHVLLLSQETTINVQELIDKSRELMTSLGLRVAAEGGSFGDCELVGETPPLTTQQPSDLYLITISYAEALCGEEDVFGKLCEEACVTSTDRPFIVEGLIVRAIPLVLQTPLPHSKAITLSRTHLRSRVASAYFEDERQVIAHLISKTNLGLQTWCMGADAASGNSVAIGVLARAGSTTVFLDPWIARRELIDTPARRYWQWRMMMRPWDVFLAQVLQFQCQLHDLFQNIPLPGSEADPCAGAGVVIGEAAKAIAELRVYYEAATNRFTTLLGDRLAGGELTFEGGLDRLVDLNNNLLLVQQNLSAVIQDRLLIRGGIIDLPSAGYLPIALDSNMTVNQQVRQMMGEGVDLRFCIVRPDYVAHALEEAQHMERISLIEGLDDPKKKPEVDILVPDGEIIEQKSSVPGIGFEASVDISKFLGIRNTISDRSAYLLDTAALKFRGAARSEKLVSGGGAVYLSVDYQPEFAVVQPKPATPASDTQPAETAEVAESTVRGAKERVSTGDLNRLEQIYMTASNLVPRDIGLWMGLRCERNVFALQNGETTNVNAQAVLGPRPSPVEGQAKRPLFYVELNGLFEITQAANPTSPRVVKGRFNNAQFFHQTPQSDDPGDVNTMTVSLNATITLTNDANIEVSIEHVRTSTFSFNIRLAASWSGEPLAVQGAIAIEEVDTARATKAVIDLLRASLKENADVMLDQNPDHVLALQGLEAAAVSLNNLGFADAKAKLLFPPLTKLTDELVVRGKRDWVLFHRRRNKQCSEEKIAPPPLPSRHYNVYHLLTGSTEGAQSLKQELINGNLPESRLTKLPSVEFAGGAPTLLTDAQGFRQAWQSANPGNLILVGLIASGDTAAADGNSLALARLGRLEAAVSSISTPAPDATNEVLPRVPSNITVDGTDGAIFLFTMRRVITICNSVFRVREGDMARVREALRTGNLGTAIGQFSVRAGNVTFDGVIPDAEDLQAFATNWANLGGGLPKETMVITSTLDATITQELAESQAAAIKQAITPAGSTSPEPTYQPTRVEFDPALEVCPIITFIEPQNTVGTLTAFIIYAPLVSPSIHIISANSLHATVEFVNNVPRGDDWERFKQNFTQSLPIRGVSYATLGTIVTGDQGPIFRVNNVIVGLGRSPGTFRGPAIGEISPQDRQSLSTMGFLTAGLDEVIFLEQT